MLRTVRITRSFGQLQSVQQGRFDPPVRRSAKIDLSLSVDYSLGECHAAFRYLSVGQLTILGHH
jgi:hypothetical protein